MKKYYMPLFFLLLLFVACSEEKKEVQEPEAPDRSHSNPSELGEPLESDDKMAGDEQKRDTVEITLKALGNSMAEMRFDKKELKVPANSIVHLTLVNEGKASAMIHNFVLVVEGTMEVTAKAAMKAGPDKEYVPDARTVLAASPLAQPQQTVEMTFEAPEAGTYEYICSYPGHWQKMNGKFIVEESVEAVGRP